MTDWTATIRHLRWQILELDDMAAHSYRAGDMTGYLKLSERADEIREELALALRDSERR